MFEQYCSCNLRQACYYIAMLFAVIIIILGRPGNGATIREADMMEDMIKRILEIDRQARNMTADAEKARIKAQSEIGKQAAEIHDQYMKDAQEHIARLEHTEQEQAKQQLAAKEEQHEKLKKNLETRFAKHRDEWIEQIVQRTLME